MRPRLFLALLLPACVTSLPAQEQPRSAAPEPVSAAPLASAAPTPPRASSPLTEPWSGPFGGVPPFALVKLELFKPALEAAMDEKRAEIRKIVESKEPPTFSSTIEPLEDAGRTMDRVETLYGVWASTMSSAEFKALEREMAPRLSAFEDEISQDAALFARVDAVFRSPEKARLTPEQQRLIWKIHTSMVRAGARLDPDQKKRVSDINQRLASLYTRFGQNVLGDEEELGLLLEKEGDLDGLPASVRSGAAAAAEGRGQKGKWFIANTRSAVEPFLTYSTRDDLREKVWKTFVNRGDNGGARDNNAIIADILALRLERARLLGYPSHAHWRLENAMARTPERAMRLMEEVWKPAIARVKEEVADMQALAPKKRKIAPWDYRHLAEKVRKAKFDIDENEVKEYLQLERLREGMFWVAGELFGFTFSPASDVPTYHPDVRVYEVKDRGTGKHVGLWYFDPYARPGKRSGAWMNAYRAQERFRGQVTTIVSNNSNFIKGKEGEPVLISWSDASTLFHEFGHALHGLCSDVTYPSLAGTRVARDYVEFPSQLLEHWLSTPEVLGRFALHHKTGAPMPPALAAKIARAATFNQGFQTVEYLSAAIIDMKLHTSGPDRVDADAFERDTLKALQMPEEIVMRHRTPQFNHVFSGDGYSAGYYSYLWSDTLKADAFNAFLEGKGPYDKEVARRLRTFVFSVGDTIDPAEGYRLFRGRDVDTSALMRERGFSSDRKASTRSDAPARSTPPRKK